MDDQFLKQQYFMMGPPQSPPWMTSAARSKEIPEWVNREEMDLNQQMQSQRMQTPRERIIPISFERSTPVARSPINVASQPYYGNNHILPKPGN